MFSHPLVCQCRGQHRKPGIVPGPPHRTPRSVDNLKRWGNAPHRRPCLDQSSSQKWKVSPFPSWGRKNLCTIGTHRLTLDMKAESLRVKAFQIFQSSRGLYPSLSTADTRSSHGCINQHTHLVNRAMLVCKRSRMPSPPWDTGRHMVFHATSAAPRVSSDWGPLQKKLRMIFSRHLLTPAECWTLFLWVLRSLVWLLPLPFLLL